MKLTAIVLSFLFSAISLFATPYTQASASAACGSQTDSNPNYSHADVHCGEWDSASATAEVGSWFVSASTSARGNSSVAYASADAYLDLGWFRFFGGSGQGIALFSVMSAQSDYGQWGLGGTTDGVVYFTFGVPIQLGLYANATAGSSNGDMMTSTAFVQLSGPYAVINSDGEYIDSLYWYYDNGTETVPELSGSTMIALGLVSVFFLRAQLRPTIQTLRSNNNQHS